MKKLIPFLLLLFVNTLFAQQRVALHHNGSTQIFGGASPFVDAYNAAVTGDTIYLPGGTLIAPGGIDKGLKIFGVGHYPDYTLALNKSLINGSITIYQNADNVYIEGIEFTGNIVFESGHKVDNAIVKRCKVADIYFNGSGTVTTRCENALIQGNVFNTIILGNAYSCLVTNNLINNSVAYGSNNVVRNNICFVSGSWNYPFYSISNTTFENNIIFQSDAAFVVSGSMNTFSYNIFPNIPIYYSNNFESNNYFNVNLSTLFVNQTGGVFDYAHDYHLTSPTTYIDAVGNQIGIYGGYYPYKTAAVPSNPHIQTKTIAPQTDSNGNLNIQIKVSSQNN